MSRRCGLVLILAVVSGIVVRHAVAMDSVATRPYYTLFVASIDRVLDLGEVVFDSVDRPDLADSLTERLKGFRDFAGIDRSKPLGVMKTWTDETPAEVLFIPVDEIDELLKTATFGVVGYHQVNSGLYEIERPGSPYYCVVRKKYAYLADSVETVNALQVTPEQLTRGFRESYEAAILIDLKQIPLTVKKLYIQSWRQQIEPWLQPLDDEEPESARFRKTIGKLLLDSVERIVLDTESSVIGAHLDPTTRQFRFEVIVRATPGSPMSMGMNRWVASRSDLKSLVTPEVPAGVSVNLPIGGIVDQILGTDIRPAEGSRLEAALQLVGNGLGSLTLLAALQGEDVAKLNDTVPNLILKLEKSGWLVDVRGSFEKYKDVILHGMVPRTIPDTITQLVGPDPDIVLGQGKRVVWLGIGRAETLTDRLHDAIDSVDDVPATDGRNSPVVPLVRARFQASRLPELVTSDLLLPKGDEESTRAAFANGHDGFSLTIEPVDNGIRLRIEAEEGFVRLIGRDWIKQIEISSP